MQALEPWNAFERYIRQPYAPHSYAASSIGDWGKDLHTRHRHGEDLHLSFVEAHNEITGKKFNAFCLNDQIYISDNPAVLALPHAPSTQDSHHAVSPGQWVGIWLHDYGQDDAYLRACDHKVRKLRGASQRKRYDVTPENAAQYPYAQKVCDTLRQALADPDLPGGTANTIGSADLNFARQTPAARHWHRDVREPLTSSHWGRILIHPILRTGPCFSLNGGEHVLRKAGAGKNTLVCPAGVTSSHAAGKCNEQENPYTAGLSPWHRAQGHPAGRVILLINRYADHEPLRDIPTPWKISCLTLAA